LNARVQGLDVFYRVGFAPTVEDIAAHAQGRESLNTPEDYARQKTFMIRASTVVALSVAAWLLNHDDPEYKKQEQETKDNNFIIPHLGIKIPVANEIGFLFKVLPERIMSYLEGDDTAKDFNESMKRGIESMLGFQWPQAVLPIIENQVNYSFFTGRAIVPPGMENVEPEYQFTPSTSKTAQIMGHALGYSPIKIDHYIQGYTGALGTYTTLLIDSILSTQDNAPRAAMRFEQMPFIKRFALDPEARGNVSSYYDLKDQVDTAVRTQNLLEKTHDFEHLGEYTQEHSQLLALKEYVNKLDQQMLKLNNQAKIIRASPMDPDSKRSVLEAIGNAQNSLTANIQYLKKQLL
jgi:hypothetical protein